MWQSWVEIEHYSVAHFDRITAFKVLSRRTSWGIKGAWIPDKSTPCPALNGSSALQRFERYSAVEICNRIMFDFYLGLPRIAFYFSFSLIIIICFPLQNCLPLCVSLCACVWMFPFRFACGQTAAKRGSRTYIQNVTSNSTQSRIWCSRARSLESWMQKLLFER